MLRNLSPVMRWDLKDPNTSEYLKKVYNFACHSKAQNKVFLRTVSKTKNRMLTYLLRNKNVLNAEIIAYIEQKLSHPFSSVSSLAMGVSRILPFQRNSG